jgi:hypothetical protein
MNMKKTRIKIAVIAAILGFSYAFTFKIIAIRNKQTTFIWYAVSTDGINFSWVSSIPPGYTCQMGHGTCEISTTIPGTPPNNGYPSSYIDLEGADHQSLLMPE